MVHKYQNEIAPIFYYGISIKTNEKNLKIPHLQPPDWKSPYWMSLYLQQTKRNILQCTIFFVLGTNGINVQIRKCNMDVYISMYIDTS